MNLIFTFLDFTIKNTADEAEGIASRILAGSRACFSLKKILGSHLEGKQGLVRRKTNLRVYKTLIKPVVTYASEKWTLRG